MAPSAQIIDLAESRDDTSLVTFLKAVADDLRLHILRVLSQDSFSVSELCTIFAVRQSALSHHLKILSDAGLLSRKKEGTATFYRRALPDGSLVTLQSQVLEHIDNEPVTKQSKSALDTRSKAARGKLDSVLQRPYLPFQSNNRN